jgi:ATP-binding cassette subfamily G (WHITE) protein 2 (SNQ2)
LSIRGEGTPDEVIYGPSLGAILFPWTTRKYRKKAQKLAEARTDGETAPPSNMSYSPSSSDAKSSKKLKKGEDGLRKGERYLIKDFSGLVRGGEMMLVVGRPGAGCTTFLKALAGLNNGYAGVEGVVRYGNMVEGKGLKAFRSDVIFNSEEGEFETEQSVVK